MRALDRKLVRDLWTMKSQALAISLVISSGVATFLMSIATLDSLKLTQATFYREQQFADAFASLKRAPESLKRRIEEIRGVQRVQTRVVAGANIDIESYPEPITAQIVSVPDDGQPLLNQLYLKAGRMPDPTHDNEVMVSEAFADAHRLRPGDRFPATINGRRRTLEIVGIALAPDFIYQLQPGALIPDFKSFGILWMARTPLESAFDMKSAFNDLALSLTATGSAEDVIAELDNLLARYGGLGAYARKDQISHRFLSEEFAQLEQMATMFPVIFLGVAAFLLNVVVSRLVATQRDQMAILKAFGYTNAAVVFHFLKFVSLIVIVGAAIGVAAGAWLASGMSRMYMDFYRFPELQFVLRPQTVITATLISLAAAVAGTLFSVIRAARLTPAEAMRPAAPAKYRVSLVERLGLKRLAQPTRMIVRNIERRPVKALLTVIGIAFACAILMTGRFFSNAIDYMVNVQFRLAQHEDIAVTLIEPTSSRALYSLANLPGVEHVEPFRSVPARLRFEHRSYRTAIQGYPEGGRLRLLLNTDLQPVEPPSDGILLTDHLAKILAVRPGELLTVEVLEGSRPVRRIPVAGVIREYVGVGGYMQLAALNEFMREGSAISGALLQTDREQQSRVYSELRRMPRVAGTAVREKALENFYETMADQVLVFAFFNTLLAGTIAFGVVYNSSRIALAERSRELASLRVLGFTRGEIAYILLGELGLLTLASLPVGFLIGRAICAGMIQNVQTDLFRIPLVINPSTYSFAAAVVLASSLISALILKRQLNRLDLVAVLKTKE
ncbi:MAG: ABC transporter permease [Bryobacteraceae bacterium]